MDERFSISEAAAKTGLSVHTLRYYERIGLLAPVGRAGGRRSYTADDIGWLGMLDLLRATGMGIADMVAFAELTRGGDGTIPDRVAVLERHRDRLCQRLARDTEHLAAITRKIGVYRDILDHPGQPRSSCAMPAKPSGVAGPADADAFADDPLARDPLARDPLARGPLTRGIDVLTEESA